MIKHIIFITLFLSLSLYSSTKFENYRYIKKEFINYIKTENNYDFKQFLEKLYYSTNNSNLKDSIANIYNRLYDNTDIDNNITTLIDITYNSSGYRTYSDGSIAQSCNDYFTNNEPYVYSGDIGDGLYMIDPQNSGNIYIAYCDMNNGGWTLVGMLFEDNKFNWNSIIDINRYHNDLDNRTSFILPNNYIPSHQYVGFGKDYNAIFIDGIEMNFQNSDFLYSSVYNLDGVEYSVYRNSSGYYDGLDYEDGKVLKRDKKDYKGCFSLDVKNIHSYSWTFCPNHKSIGYRGFNMNGNSPQKDSFAWTLWVK